MKNCHKWMLVCVVVALAIAFVLPRFGVSLAGASFLVPLLMIGCCVLPMLFMTMSARDGKESSCCSKEGKPVLDGEKGTEKLKSESGSCH